jgi:DNA-binding NarL/FixJ family response regulator
MLRLCDNKTVIKTPQQDVTENNVITIMVVDDHQVMREGMRRILETDKSLKFIGEATNGKEAVEMAKRLDPDVITMDIRMPLMDGIAATREIKRLMPDAIIIVLTLFADDDYVEQALEAGASGFILKDSDSHIILDSIHQACDGFYPISPSLTREMMSQFAQLLKSNREQILTERQVEILKLVSDGLSSKEIADKVFVSPSTAKREIRQIMVRLQVNDRAQAVSKAIHQKLI